MEHNTEFVKVQIASFPSELHRELRIRALRRREPMGVWLARAVRNQVVLEDGSAEALALSEPAAAAAAK